MRYTYDDNGAMLHAEETHNSSVTVTRIATDLNQDGTITDEEFVEQVTYTNTHNIYRVINNQAVIVESSATSVTVTPTETRRSTSQTVYNVDSLGRVTGASGTSSDETRTLTADGKTIVRTSNTTNTYIVMMGQAVVASSVTTSNTYSHYEGTNYLSAANVSTSTMTSYNQYDASGMLVGARQEGTTLSWTTNADGTRFPNESRVENTMIILFGQAQVLRSVTMSLSPTPAATRLSWM